MAIQEPTAIDEEKKNVTCRPPIKQRIENEGDQVLIRILLIHLQPQCMLMNIYIVPNLLRILVLRIRWRRSQLLLLTHRRPNPRPPTSLISIIRMVIDTTHHRVSIIGCTVPTRVVVGMSRWRCVRRIKIVGRWIRG